MRRFLAALFLLPIVFAFMSDDASARTRHHRKHHHARVAYVDCFTDRGYGTCGTGVDITGQWMGIDPLLPQWGQWTDAKPKAKRRAVKVAVAHPEKTRKVKRSSKSVPMQTDETVIKLGTPFGVKILERVSRVLDSGFPRPLVAKVNEIVSGCGSRIASAYRPGARVAGSGRVSNHALKKAVDVAGNPSCIYAHLKGWPGGYSTDYYSAPGGQHVHISYNPNKEWGARFVHYHGGRSHYLAASRHHRKHHRRYARAW